MTSAHNSPRQLHPSPNAPQSPIFDLPTPDSDLPSKNEDPRTKNSSIRAPENEEPRLERSERTREASPAEVAVEVLAVAGVFGRAKTGCFRRKTLTDTKNSPISDLPTPLPSTKNEVPRTKNSPKKPHTGVTRYDPEFAILICERIATTPESLAAICRAPDMPGIATIFRWLREHPDFQQLYVEAKQSQAEILIDQALEIVDDSSHDLIERPDGRIVANSAALQRSKMRVEFRKWIASKLLPRKYGYQKESSPAAAQARTAPHPSGTPGIVPMSEEERMKIIEQHLRETAEPPPGLDDPDAPIWGDWYPTTDPTDPTESPEHHPADPVVTATPPPSPIVPLNPNLTQPATSQPTTAQPATSQPTVRTNRSPTEPASSQPAPLTPAKRPPSPPEHYAIREPKRVRSPMNKACT